MIDSHFWFALGITALLELVLHWAPWPRTLPRVVAYTFGVAGILLGAGLWLIPTGQGAIYLGLIAVCAAAGLGTVTGYGVDWVRNLIVRASLAGHHGADE